MRYLDPKADLTFKKIFGEHKDLQMTNPDNPTASNQKYKKVTTK